MCVLPQNIVSDLFLPCCSATASHLSRTGALPESDRDCGKRNLIKRIQNGLVDALADTVWLRMSYPAPGMLDAVLFKVKLIIVAICFAVIFRRPIGRNTNSLHIL